MTRSWLLAAVAMLVLVPVRSSARQGQAPPNQPGMPTVARMVVANQGREEAVPVVLQAGPDVLPVAVISAPALSLAPGATVATRPARQAWEHRQIVFTTAEDVGTGLAQAGADGWEAVGITATTTGRVQVLLKRPR